jgi:hypothetical protein
MFKQTAYTGQTQLCSNGKGQEHRLLIVWISPFLHNTNTTDCISLFLPHPSEMSKLNELEKELPDCLFTPKCVIAPVMKCAADKET